MSASSEDGAPTYTYDDEYVAGMWGEVDRWRRMAGCTVCAGRGWLPFYITLTLHGDGKGGMGGSAPPCKRCAGLGVQVSRWNPLRRWRLHRIARRPMPPSPPAITGVPSGGGAG